MRQPILRDTGLRLVGTLFVIVAGWGVVLGPVQAQDRPEEVQYIEAAETLFGEGVDAFEREAYEAASERFRRAAEYPLNEKTTAALLMEGKALYEMEEYDEARTVLQQLVQRFPSSRYRDEARRVMEYAREAEQQTREEPDAIRLGVALPLGESSTLTQAMFNGIRLAVEERNGIERRLVPVDTTYYTVADTIEGEGDSAVVEMRDTMRVERTVEVERVAPARRPVQLFFRDSGDDPDRARAAIDTLVNDDRVDAIIGPLFIREARAAGAEAERNRVVLIAPLANVEDIAQDRQYVFQANPPIRTRGEIMAQFAVRSLLADTLGVIIEQGNDFSAQMAEGFREEVERQGGTLSFYETLPSPRVWSRLPEHFESDSLFSPDTLRGTDGVYLPIEGRDAAGRIQDALTGLDRLQGYGLRARALGNAEWHNLAIEQVASQFNTIYTNDFYADQRRSEVREFVRRYRLLTGETPDEIGATARRLAYTGYDVADFLLDAMEEERSGTSLPDRLRNASRYEGGGTRIDFRGDNVNRAMFIHRYRAGRIELIR